MSQTLQAKDHSALGRTSDSGVILTAGYILWTIQRVYLGPEYKGPHPEALSDMDFRESTIAWTLLVFAIVLGVFPNTMFSIMDRSTSALTASMAEALPSTPVSTSAASPPRYRM